MRILILRSDPQTQFMTGKDAYTTKLDTNYATRFLAHFTNQPGYCRACGDNCAHCKRDDRLDFSAHLAGVISFPAYLPVLLEEADEFLPASVPPHDLLIVLAVHEEIILAFLKKFPLCRALLVPQEAPHWLSPFGQNSLAAFCRSRQIESAFPKPFCSFAPVSGRLKDFQQFFRLGKPSLGFRLKANRIEAASVLVSAPCGATYYTARQLEGRLLTDNLSRIAGKALSCYPCTASTGLDMDTNDSLMHKAAHIQQEILMKL